MINNRLTDLFNKKKNNILNIYFTAGYPEKNSTAEIIRRIESAGADLVEVGLPYSDPLADGKTIQDSSIVALKNGINLFEIFKQVKEARKSVELPIILMGYVNQIIQFGLSNFIEKCSESGVDGLIIPDMPPQNYCQEMQHLCEKHNIAWTFLVTPQTEIARIKYLDSLTTGFLYVVSSASITGAKNGISDNQIEYFKKIESLNLTSPTLIGFGISDAKTFSTASKYSNGAIIGSAFIKMLSERGVDGVEPFIRSIIDC